MKNGVKKIIVGNWKMNPEKIDTAKKLVADINRRASKSKKSLIVLCPPTIFLSEVRGRKPPKKVKFGLQDVHYEKSGAFTGEISATMAKNMKAEFSIIGHSERRAMGETNEIISRKMAAALRSDIVPILCVGEKEVDEHADHLSFVKEQLTKGLASVSQTEIEKIIIAYEPVYAIGASEAVGPHVIYQRNIFIKKILTEMYGKQKAFGIPILYGGSINVDNAKEIIRDGSVDGLLIGRASLKAEDFLEIIARVESIK